MARAQESSRQAEVVCRMCGAEYRGEVVMKSRAVPGVMGPVGEMLKNAVDGCPVCGSYNIRLKHP
ncbi:hypothetical protein [Rubrobacter indicoceani]|uniref:hypothetical protein n=1 Tax=Rubrobacter indicoceani TaxID=2051957 RepID=UPI0013C4C079|nr:hypothetical protein [Rubrobacter indicoceani]